MKKLFWQMNVTLDSLMEGPNQELDSTAEFEDKDFKRYVAEMLNSIDAILLGRVTYELFAGFWPAATLPEARRMNELQKIVFSRTLETVEWKNSRLVKGNVADEIAKLKSQPGKEIAVFGSADLASTLMRHGLIDEYRIFVNPVVLGSGTPMFKGIKDRIALKLLQATTMSSGVVALYYQPA